MSRTDGVRVKNETVVSSKMKLTSCQIEVGSSLNTDNTKTMILSNFDCCLNKFNYISNNNKKFVKTPY